MPTDGPIDETDIVAVGADLGLLMQGAQAALLALHRQAGDVEVHTLAEGTVVASKGR